MKPTSIAGILLVILGVLALAYQGFTYTHREKVLDVGPIHATKDTQETVPISPIVGGLALVGGIARLNGAACLACRRFARGNGRRAVSSLYPSNVLDSHLPSITDLTQAPGFLSGMINFCAFSRRRNETVSSR